MHIPNFKTRPARLKPNLVFWSRAATKFDFNFGF